MGIDTFICPWPAGGTADQTMRALCSAGMIGLKAMAFAKPDGYTIGQIQTSLPKREAIPENLPTYIQVLAGPPMGDTSRCWQDAFISNLG